MAETRRGWLPPGLLLALVAGALAYSAVDPVADRLTWFLETMFVIFGAPVLVFTHRRWPLTDLTYHLLTLFALVMIWGGHYTYADNPLFDWLQREFDLARNYYDRLGHLLQGMVPAMLAREVLVRASPVKRGGWLFLFTTSVTLTVSVGYEFLEWWVAVIEGSEATAFLATQGDPWDTQWDMFLALCGAVAAQLLLARVQDRQLRALGVG